MPYVLTTLGFGSGDVGGVYGMCGEGGDNEEQAAQNSCFSRPADQGWKRNLTWFGINLMIDRHHHLV